MLGIGAGAVIGALIGAGVASGNSFAIGGIKALANKFISDSVGFLFFGKSFGSLEDYAVAFAFGAFLNGFKIEGLAKNILDVFGRPAVTQGVKILTRGDRWDLEKYTADVISRTLTLIFGRPDPLKAIVRGFNSGFYSYMKAHPIYGS